MGNLCGKQSNDDPFAQPGRTIASAGASTNINNNSGNSNSNANSKPTAPLPRKVGGPARTLGGAGAGGAGGGGGTAAEREDARKKAAEAAEARAKEANRPKGKLGERLAEQKKQSRNDTLGDLSRDERRQREVDSAQESRNFN
ncbi:hypothetical protein PVAG01_01289 [Phlyctema vagabunda]|uniref:Small EDRK-rich factor-like N-terminal domain-containing protein n=1 Tax=Phlyctema vagabunda TaxID=108571 RepID=A0ABR4PWQ8_9HELO